MTYNPASYWGQSRKRNQTLVPIAAAEVMTLARVLRLLTPATVLEVGSGWGRVYLALKLLGLAENVTLCDFTEHQRQKCLEFTGVEPDTWDGVTLPYEDDSFDLVLSFDVMLHVPPSDLARFLAEHVRVTQRWLYVATLWQGDKDKLAPHCFIHDYDFAPLHMVKMMKFSKRAHYLLEKPGWNGDHPS